MACFLVPMAEAAAVTIAAQIAKKSEPKVELDKVTVNGEERAKTQASLPMSKKLMFLSYLLWGGVALLAFEHVWHGEVVPWFPFLTAASNPLDAAEMLHEMSTIGVTMAVIVTGVWAAVMAVVRAKVRQIKSAVHTA